jgi:hypothetical protein
MGNLNSKNDDTKYPGNRIEMILSLTDYFKPGTYDLHKFVSLIKKPKIIKVIQVSNFKMAIKTLH